jgi:hypothetical protein
MKTLNKIFILLVSAALFSAALNAQTKPVPPTDTRYSSSNSTNDVNSLTTVKPQPTEFSAEKKDLLRQLDAARTLNNIQLKEQLEAQLNRLNGTTPVQLTVNPGVIGGAVTGDTRVPFNNEPDYQNTQIVSGGLFSSATQTESAGMPHPGRVWAATTIFNPAGSDTCKVYFSDDGGQNWAFGYYFYFNTNMDFRPGELDIELVYDGSILWIYGVAGYKDVPTNRVSSILFRFNTTANTFSGYLLAWPGNTASNMYYNPRITSDNSFYTSSSYVYFTCSFDSTTGANHFTRQKYAHITNPFDAVPTIDYSQPSNSGGFYWQSSSLPAGSYLWTDIAYFKTSTNVNRIITVYNIPAGATNNQFLAWSDDYGATISGFPIITETNADYGSRMVFNGGANNQNGMIAYVRQYNGNDWDPFCKSTTDGGATWTSNYIDQSTNRARSVDIIAPRGGNNIFKVGYTQDSASATYGYYTGGNGATWNLPPTHPVTPAVDTIYTKIIAGYRNGGGDDCFALYSIGNGAGLYSSRLCQTTLGIINNNTGVPKSYTLSQNYPNPFNPSTNIKFSIPKSGIVKLTIFDITGKVVATLVDEQLNSGSYTYDFDASNIASGVYFYKLQTDGFTDVKKMLLVK